MRRDKLVIILAGSLWHASPLTPAPRPVIPKASLGIEGRRDLRACITGEWMVKHEGRWRLVSTTGEWVLGRQRTHSEILRGRNLSGDTHSDMDGPPSEPSKNQSVLRAKWTHMHGNTPHVLSAYHPTQWSC